MSCRSLLARTHMCTQDKTKWIHRWFGRAINLWAFFVAFTGYELANYGTNDGTDGGGEDFDNIVIIFCFWAIFRFGCVSLSA